MKQVSQFAFASLVVVFVVFIVGGDVTQTQAQDFELQLEIDWPKIPGFGDGDENLNDLLSERRLSLSQLVLFVYSLLLWISIILAFLSLVYAGFLYVVSGANSNIRAKAFDRVKRIVTGSLILLLAVLILSFINTDLVANWKSNRSS